MAFANYITKPSQNISAGLSNYLNPEINVGDTIEINAQKGTIVYLGLTKTTIMTDDGARIFVPNLKFTEELLKVFHKKQQCRHFKEITKTASPKTQGCEECEKEGGQWNSLRMCLSCGHVGCDRSSSGRHAKKTFQKNQTSHHGRTARKKVELVLRPRFLLLVFLSNLE